MSQISTDKSVQSPDIPLFCHHCVGAATQLLRNFENQIKLRFSIEILTLEFKAHLVLTQSKKALMCFFSLPLDKSGNNLKGNQQLQ